MEQTYLLQYLNRAKDQPYNYRNRMQPMEMRIKPKAGFIEVDVPMNVHLNYNKHKGVRWGEALRKAKEDGQNSFGVASGFERVPMQRGVGSRPGGRPSPTNLGGEDMEDDIDDLLRRFDDANDKGHVMNKQTLGGQVLKDESGKPRYMLGTFRGSMTPYPASHLFASAKSKKQMSYISQSLMELFRCVRNSTILMRLHTRTTQHVAASEKQLNLLAQPNLALFSCR